MGVDKKIGITKQDRDIARRYCNRFRLSDHKLYIKRMFGKRILFLEAINDDGLEYLMRFTKVKMMKTPTGNQVTNKLHYLKVQMDKVHGVDKYDLSEIKEVKYQEKLPIKCKKHGVFYKTKSAFITQREGCPKCSLNKYNKNRKYY